MTKQLTATTAAALLFMTGAALADPANTPATSIEEQATDTLERSNPTAPPAETGSISTQPAAGDVNPTDDSPGGSPAEAVTEPLESRTDPTQP